MISDTGLLHVAPHLVMGGGRRTMRELTDELLREVVGRLVDELDPVAIYMFGSHARNEAGPDSDVDLMVVVRETDQHPRELARRGRQSLWGLGMPFDIVVCTEADIRKWSEVPCNLIHTARTEGREVYVAHR